MVIKALLILHPNELRNCIFDHTPTMFSPEASNEYINPFGSMNSHHILGGVYSAVEEPKINES
jgi:hypothetical protein